jgi:serpin B
MFAIGRVLLATMALAAFTLPALADDWKECANVADEEPAIAACNRLISGGKLSRVDRATVYSNRGAAYLNLGDYELAMRDLNEALHLDGRSAHAFYNRGATYFFKREYDKAIVDLSRALRLGKGDVKTYLYRGRSHYELDHYKDAIADFSAGLRIDPGNASLLLRRGHAFHASEDYNSALADYDHVARLEPDNVALLIERARVLVQLGRPDEAMRDIARALEQDANLAQAHVVASEVLEAQGRVREAAASARRALEIQPNYAYARQRLARLDAGGPAPAAPASANRQQGPQPVSAGSTAPATPRASVAALQAGFNTVGVDLLRELVKANGSVSVAVSPYSIGTAMGMLLFAATGETEREMRQVLLQTLPRDAFAEANALALGLLRRTAGPATQIMPSDGRAPDRGAPFEIKIANAVALGPTGRSVARPYIAQLGAKFDAQVLPNATLQSINAWVRERTDGRIPEILESLHPQFPLVLLNAVTLTARWAERFEARDTHHAPFLLGGRSPASVETMHKLGNFALAEWQGLRAVRIPYADTAAAMLVVVPDKPDRFAGSELGISMRDLDPLLASLAQATPQKVDLALPKFGVKFKANLVEPFRQLGLGRTLSAGAEFGHMVEPPASSPVVDQIQHRVAVDVGELGTEAAAATAISMAPGAGASAPAPKVPEFKVDRPFLFLIVDYNSGAVLFLGRIADPRGT